MEIERTIENLNKIHSISKCKFVQLTIWNDIESNQNSFAEQRESGRDREKNRKRASETEKSTEKEREREREGEIERKRDRASNQRKEYGELPLEFGTITESAYH